MDLRQDAPAAAVESVRMPRWVAVALALTAVLLAGYALHTLFLIGGHGADDLFLKWINDVICAVSAAAILARGVHVRRQRLAWILLGLGLLTWTVGNVYYSLFLIDIDPLPVPSVADYLWLAMYPFTYVALILLMLDRVRSFNVSMSLDGLIAATAAGSVSAALVVGQVLEHLGHGSIAEIATNLAYPIGDLILLGLVLGALALNGWRPDRTWAVLAAAFLTGAVTDGTFLYKMADGTYAAGTIIDAGWLLGALLLGLAAWQPLAPAAVRRSAGQGTLVVPALFGLLSLGILVWDHFHRVNTLALVLASASVSTVILRMALAFAENARLARREARALVVENEHIDADRAERARLLARAVEMAEHERIRIAVDLHDGPIQLLTALAFRVDRLGVRLGPDAGAGVPELVGEIRESLAAQIEGLRRLMTDLRPPILDERDLASALHDCADEVLEGLPLRWQTRTRLDSERPAPELETAIYRVVREALLNIRKYAQASSVDVSLQRVDDKLHLAVVDDGAGFELAAVGEGRFGLLGMHERVESLGGRIHVSAAPGHGTQIHAVLPWKPASAEPPGRRRARAVA